MDLRSFQHAVDERFGDADRARDIPSTVAWLTEELGELAQAVRKGSPDDQRHEFGDVLAWLASLASQLGIDLADAASSHLARTAPDRRDPGGPDGHDMRA